MPGPVPKPSHQRQRKNRTTTAATLEAPPATRASLPEREPPWHARTVAWWETIWASPMAEEWVDADVPGLFALAQLVDDFWQASGADRVKLAAEVRMQQREYGLSPLSRRQLQWEVRKVESAKAPAPSSRRSGPGVFSVLEGKGA